LGFVGWFQVPRWASTGPDRYRAVDFRFIYLYCNESANAPCKKKFRKIKKMKAGLDFFIDSGAQFLVHDALRIVQTVVCLYS
jgi:elongation factor P hydroxylase